MREHRKAQIRTLLKGIETGDPAAVAVVDEARYIQHNPQTQEGSIGLAALFARLAKTEPSVRMVRVFADGDFVFAHMEYDFSTRRVAFEVFRFDGDFAVEHWVNIQRREGPNASGRSMTDGPVEVGDPRLTEATRDVVRSFVESSLIGGRFDAAPVSGELLQHDPTLADGWGAWQVALTETHQDDRRVVYSTLHRVLAEGAFALAVSEGWLAGSHTAFYDLFRVEDGVIVEHWNTVEHVAPRSEWKNDNGKF